MPGTYANASNIWVGLKLPAAYAAHGQNRASLIVERGFVTIESDVELLCAIRDGNVGTHLALSEARHTTTGARRNTDKTFLEEKAATMHCQPAAIDPTIYIQFEPLKDKLTTSGSWQRINPIAGRSEPLGS